MAQAIWLSRWQARRHPEWIRAKENTLDERSERIRHEAGYKAFGTTFVLVVLYTLLSPAQLLQQVSYASDGIVFIYVMMLSYWGAVFIASRKY